MSRRTRHDQAVALLMAMNTRSADDCYQFAVLLCQTKGIQDVGHRLLYQSMEQRSRDGHQGSLLHCTGECRSNINACIQSQREVTTWLPPDVGHDYTSRTCNMRDDSTVLRETPEVVFSPWKRWRDIPRESCWPWNCVMGIPPSKLVVGDQADLLSLDLDTNTWKTYNLGNVNIHSVFSCGLTLDPHVLLLDKRRNTFAVERYSMTMGNRQHVSDLPPTYQAHLGQHMTVAADREHIFVVSGRTNTYEPLNCVWLYHLRTDCWQRIADMSVKRCACSPFVLDGVLYVGGGIVKTSQTDWIGCELVEYFSERENCWRYAALTKNSRSRLMPHNGMLLSVGGTKDREAGDVITSDIELINLQTSMSSSVPCMSHGRRGHGIFVDAAGSLFVVGGYNKQGFLTSVESYRLGFKLC